MIEMNTTVILLGTMLLAILAAVRVAQSSSRRKSWIEEIDTHRKRRTIR